MIFFHQNFIHFNSFHPIMMFSSEIWMKLLQYLFHWCRMDNKWKITENRLFITSMKNTSYAKKIKIMWNFNMKSWTNQPVICTNLKTDRSFFFLTPGSNLSNTSFTPTSKRTEVNFFSYPGSNLSNIWLMPGPKFFFFLTPGQTYQTLVLMDLKIWD